MSAPPNEQAALCVVIHDVAPATWPDCLRLLQAVRAVADIPLTWLAVPRWHGGEDRSPACEAALDSVLADGHEIALHGYTHVDTAAARRDWRSRFLRGVYTEGEGEFAALDAAEARRRIELGLAWFDERGWLASGFVAPAWLLSDGAWEAVRSYPFLYTTTWNHFHVLMPMPSNPAIPTPPLNPSAATPPLQPSFPREDGPRRAPMFSEPPPLPRALLSPSLVYAARNRAGRIVSPPLARTLARLMHASPLVRMALHPRDARHPALLRHAQQLIEHLLQSRAALTKSAFARQWAAAATSTDPNNRPATSATGPHRHENADSHSAADRPAR
ncbi:DUF2334 domain-containing protein [Massilia pseudoviolaceinigra]|uniref:DUF2334 domain-containing protein n=1 Tax=Massilia pseudoviolaceinigra TaxID=3057165 RepID=UPI0027965D51|nr:polysaccharide deacetylase family protein [Massilia sp. CCM 9206]MDQ1924545.1 DUF2334 domain-containing protein [Massilia sp. CCM 9206]